MTSRATQMAAAYWPHALITALALLSVIFPKVAADRVQALATGFLQYFDGLTLMVATGAVIFCAIVAVTPIGKHRLGGDDATPEFRTVTWIAMLFAAGMGAGLVFWGAAEPLVHTLSPPPDGARPETAEARRDALAITQFHWSLHAWSIYAVAAMAMGSYAKSSHPPLPSVPFNRLPQIGRRLIDWIALFGVVFGVVASLGAGVLQLGAGTERITGGAMMRGPGLYLVILGLLTAAYLTSAATGLKRGIAILSNINMVLALALAVYVFFAADTLGIIRILGESLASYAQSFWVLATDLRPEGEARDWTRVWSLTTLLWWVAWTPFVGAFVARISRGRRLREFVLGVVLIPSAVTLVWFAIFGGAALDLSASGVDLGVRSMAAAEEATYAVLEHLPFTLAMQVLTALLVFTFLLTSADSGSYVLGMFAQGQPGEPPVAERLYWGALLAVLSAAALLSDGGHAGVRAFAVSGAIPMLFLLICLAAAVLWRHRPFRTSRAP